MMISVKALRLFALVIFASVLVACGSGNSHQDLQDFMSEVRARPKGEVEPLPTFSPYKAFNYAAMTLRSPFDRPVQEVQRLSSGNPEGIKPDLNREKEFLESFNLPALRMVGTLNQAGVLWALIDDGEGAVHRVKNGNYLGKNHGEIVLTTDAQLEIVEIVSNGLDGWLMRPRTIKIEEKE